MVLVISELLEYYLSTIDTLIKGCPKEITNHSGNIIELAVRLTNFDPN